MKTEEKLQLECSNKQECAHHDGSSDNANQLEPTKTKKAPKVTYLKQWRVLCYDKLGNRIGQYLLATCAAKAREALEARYGECDIIHIMQTAISEKTADWLKTHSPFYDL